MTLFLSFIDTFGTNTNSKTNTNSSFYESLLQDTGLTVDVRSLSEFAKSIFINTKL